MKQLKNNHICETILQEIRWPHEYTMEMDCYAIFNGGTMNSKHEFETYFVVNTNFVGKITNFIAVNHRINSIRNYPLFLMHNYTLISGHALTEDKKKNIKYEFYDHRPTPKKICFHYTTRRLQCENWRRKNTKTSA